MRNLRRIPNLLPFLPKLKIRDNSEIITRSPDEGKEEQNQGIETCARSLIAAIQSQDAKGVAQAFKDLMTMCESEPEAYSEPETE